MAGPLFCSPDKPSDAGRGGALAVALAFGILFSDSTKTSELFSLLANDLPNLIKDRLVSLPDFNTNKMDRLESYIDDIVEATRVCLVTNERNVRKGNLALALSSVTGTMFWGFADLLPLGYGRKLLVHLFQ